MALAVTLKSRFWCGHMTAPARTLKPTKSIARARKEASAVYPPHNKANLAMTTVIKAILVIVVLVILIILLSTHFGLFRQGTVSCEPEGTCVKTPADCTHKIGLKSCPASAPVCCVQDET